LRRKHAAAYVKKLKWISELIERVRKPLQRPP
jgi:hypothetical protein